MHRWGVLGFGGAWGEGEGVCGVMGLWGCGVVGSEGRGCEGEGIWGGGWGRRAGWWFGAQVRLGLGCGLGIGLLDLLGGFGLMSIREFEV